MKVLSIAVLVTAALTGCASAPTPPPVISAELGNTFGNGLLASQGCFELDQYTLEEHTQFTQSIVYNLNTWTYNKAEFEQQLSMGKTNMKTDEWVDVENYCQKQWKPWLVNNLSQAQNHYNQVQANAQRQHEINKAKAGATRVTNNNGGGFGMGGGMHTYSINGKMTTCNTIGGFTTCL
ncbi:hypothetical protein [Vibrio sp. WXL210]|uniref:hypothetical protein n=1 Tax=Vibrio sp. WXL210 TaxID=3450709 RepID=UPI003EC61E5C